jgi:phosphatidylglycerol:prolipoprotein diacylglycerol transferase
MNNDWFDPVLLHLGPLQIRWYGLMYVMGFFVGSKILAYLAKTKFWPLSKESIEKYVTWLILGMFLGARLFYVFIYNWDYYSENVSEWFAVWKGGLSFHGAVVGMCLATYFFAKKHKLKFFHLADSLAVAGTPGLLFGRIGNFINGELYGRVTSSPLGVVFPEGGPLPRHASQLYEGFSEGLILFIILFWLHRKQPHYGYVSAAFLLGYGIFRFMAEFFREPDSQLGFYFGSITMGQILCFSMILLSVVFYFWAKKEKIPTPYSK